MATGIGMMNDEDFLVDLEREDEEDEDGGLLLLVLLVFLTSLWLLLTILTRLSLLSILLWCLLWSWLMSWARLTEFLLSLLSLWWLLFWHFNNNVSWFTNNFSLESFFWISSICNSTDETITVYNRVWSFNNISFTWFFTVLVVGEFIILNIKSKLVWRAWLVEKKTLIH